MDTPIEASRLALILAYLFCGEHGGAERGKRQRGALWWYEPEAKTVWAEATYLYASDVAADRLVVDLVGAVEVMRLACDTLGDVDGHRVKVTWLGSSCYDWMDESCHTGDGKRSGEEHGRSS